jgi:hypothetical protein
MTSATCWTVQLAAAASVLATRPEASCSRWFARLMSACAVLSAETWKPCASAALLIRRCCCTAFVTAAVPVHRRLLSYSRFLARSSRALRGTSIPPASAATGQSVSFDSRCRSNALRALNSRMHLQQQLLDSTRLSWALVLPCSSSKGAGPPVG